MSGRSPGDEALQLLTRILGHKGRLKRKRLLTNAAKVAAGRCSKEDLQRALLVLMESKEVIDVGDGFLALRWAPDKQTTVTDKNMVHMDAISQYFARQESAVLTRDAARELREAGHEVDSSAMGQCTRQLARDGALSTGQGGWLVSARAMDRAARIVRGLMVGCPYVKVADAMEALEAESIPLQEEQVLSMITDARKTQRRRIARETAMGDTRIGSHLGKPVEADVKVLEICSRCHQQSDELVIVEDPDGELHLCGSCYSRIERRESGSLPWSRIIRTPSNGQNRRW